MKLKPYNSFWQQLHKSAKESSFPLRIIFELTYRCNFKCQHCYLPPSYKKKYPELKTKEVFSVLEQLKDIGCFYLGFTGGEPFVRKDIMDILKYAKKCGFQVIVYTNSSLINQKIADELAGLQLNKVDITIPAMSKTSFERITGITGSHQKVFKAIEFLHKRNIPLGFKTCVLKENEDEIKDIQHFADSLGALHRLDDMLSARLDGSKEPYRYRGIMQMNAKRQSDICNNSDSMVSQYTQRPTCKPDNLFKCGVGSTQAAITPWGELKMCLMIDYPKYKILKNSLKDCWLKLKGLAGKIKPDENYKCNRCKFFSFCKWCPAKSWLQKKNFTSCDPESKRKAEQCFLEIQNHL